MKRHTLCCCVVFLGGFASLDGSKGVGASGDVRGTITDSSGAIVRNVPVAVVETERGIRHTASTDSSGQDRRVALPPGSYEVSAAMPGFDTQLQKAVVVSLGETVVVDFRMKVSAQSETVEVVSEPPVVDTARASQANIVEQQSIRELPMIVATISLLLCSCLGYAIPMPSPTMLIFE